MNKIFNKQAFKKWLQIWMGISTFISLILLFFPLMEHLEYNVRFILGIVLLILLIFSYLILAIYESGRKSLHLNINNTKVNIRFSDIFSEKGIKVIAFNEYFDTQVDNVVINHSSLNGQVIDKGFIDINTFNKSLLSNEKLIKVEINDERRLGNKQKYAIGQIHKYNDEYFALAFTKFNDKNEAHLYSNEYSSCLLEMWKNLNTYYSQSIINIPLLGDGITRILDNTSITKQELLEIMLQTLKISKMTFKEPSEINIILYSGKNNENKKCFDLSRINMMFK